MWSEVLAGTEAAEESSGHKEKTAESYALTPQNRRWCRTHFSEQQCCPHPLTPWECHAKSVLQSDLNRIKDLVLNALELMFKKLTALNGSHHQPMAGAGVGWRHLGASLIPPPLARGSQSSCYCMRLRTPSKIMSSGIMRHRCPEAAVICLDLVELITGLMVPQRSSICPLFWETPVRNTRSSLSLPALEARGCFCRK